MKPRRTARLQPLGLAGASRQEQREAEALARLQRIWSRTVSPTLAGCTYPLRIRRGTLLLGCWPPGMVTSVRSGAEGAWPQLKERLARMCGLPLERLEVTPSDPPPAATRAAEAEDPLKALLEWARRHNSGWNRSRS